MSSRSTIEKMPVETQRLIEDKIIAYRFSHYKELSIELKGMGTDAPPGVLERYGKNIAKNIDKRIAASKLQSINNHRMPTENVRSLVIVIDLESGNHESFKSEVSIGEILSIIRKTIDLNAIGECHE
jgi:hypothetical protein